MRTIDVPHQHHSSLEAIAIVGSWAACTYLRLEGHEGGGGGTLLGGSEGGGAGNESGEGSKLEHGWIRLV